MDRKHLLCGVAAAALIMTGAVQARANGIEAVSVASMWQGFYFGAHLGAGRTSGVLSPGSDDEAYSTGGALAGLHLGFNWHTGGNWVWGIEGDVSFADLMHSVSEHAISVDVLSSIRARLGMPVGNALVYVTAGAGVLAGTTGSSNESDNSSFSVWRPVAGLGVAAPINDTISVRAEGLAFIGDDAPSGPSERNTIETVYVARIGIDFHLQK